MTTDWRSLPPLTSLRAFAAVAELGGFSQAAPVLNVTHSALAHTVTSLEGLFDKPVVSHDRTGHAFTEEGQEPAQILPAGLRPLTHR